MVKTINYDMYAPRLAVNSCLKLATMLHKFKVVNRVEWFNTGWGDMYRRVRGFDLDAIKKNDGIVWPKGVYEQKESR